MSQEKKTKNDLVISHELRDTNTWEKFEQVFGGRKPTPIVTKLLNLRDPDNARVPIHAESLVA